MEQPPVLFAHCSSSRHVLSSTIAGALLLLVSGTQAQDIAPQAPVAAGGHGSDGMHHLSWTLGQSMSATYNQPGHLITAGVQQPDGPTLALRITALLDGPYHTATDLMYDSLRTRAMLPFVEPYTTLGQPPSLVPAGYAFNPAALLTTGPDAIVDWVLVELRAAGAPATVVCARAALLQRDGDVVDGDGTSPLRMAAPPGQYHVAVHHRNHLPVMTLAPTVMGTGIISIDLTDGSTPTYGTQAQHQRNGRHLLWAGDVNKDGTVRYTGTNNDRDPILTATGGVAPTATVDGYLPVDVNLDGTVKYTGPDNDRDRVLQTIGGTVPTSERTQQIP